MTVMSPVRSPSPVLAPPASPPPRWRRWAIRAAVAVVLLAVAAWGAFTYMFFNPLEGDFGSLARVVPSHVAFAFRGSAEELLEAPFVNRRILARPETDELLRTMGIDFMLTELRRSEEQIDAQLPGFLKGFTVRGDVLGRETVVFGTPALHELPALQEEVDRGRLDPEALALEILGRSPAAVATRLTRRGRMVFSVIKHDWARRELEARSGIKVVRYPSLYEFDGTALLKDPTHAIPGYGALVRDVLIFGNDKKLVEDAARLARTGGNGSLPDRPDAGVLFAGEGTAPLRAFMDLGDLARRQADNGEPLPGELLRDREGAAWLAGFLLDPDALATLQARVTFPGPEECVLEGTGIRNAASLPTLPAALASGAVRPAREALEEAAILAPAGSAALVARAEIPPGLLLTLAYGRLSLDHRKLIEEQMAKSRTSLEGTARDVDDYFQPGISIVMERLPETDGLALDSYGAGPDGRFLLPLPGTLLVLRQKPGLPPGEAEKFLRRRLDEWKDDLRYREPLEGLPSGMTGIRFKPKFLEDTYDLVRPAVAFHGDMVFFSTSEGTLLRALEARDGARAAVHDMEGFAGAAEAAGEGPIAVFLDLPGWVRILRDQRREAATEAVKKDWKPVRMQEHAKVVIELMNQRDAFSAAEINAILDKRMEELVRKQREEEFPAAVKEYLAGLDRLRELRSASGTLSWDARGLSFRVVLRTAD